MLVYGVNARLTFRVDAGMMHCVAISLPTCALCVETGSNARHSHFSFITIWNKGCEEKRQTQVALFAV